MSNETGKIARCPHCGSDEFVVSESETKTVRFAAGKGYPPIKEEVLSSEGKGYDSIVCDKCDRDLNASDLFEQLAPDEELQ